MLGRAVMPFCDWGELLGFERLKREGRLEVLVGVWGGAPFLDVEGWGRLLALLSPFSISARQDSSLLNGTGASGGGEVRKSRFSHDAAIKRSSMLRPLDGALVRDFDLEVAESLPALDLLLRLFSFSRLASISERSLGMTGAGDGLPGGVSARSGLRWKSSAVRGRLCRWESKLWCLERERALDELRLVSERRLARCSLKWLSRFVGSSSLSAMTTIRTDAGPCTRASLHNEEELRNQTHTQHLGGVRHFQRAGNCTRVGT
jgi:hypothetical protein